MYSAGGASHMLGSDDFFGNLNIQKSQVSRTKENYIGSSYNADLSASSLTSGVI